MLYDAEHGGRNTMNEHSARGFGGGVDTDVDESWNGIDRRSGDDRRNCDDRRTGIDRRSGLGFRPDPDRRIGSSLGASRCPWGNADRRQAIDRRKSA